MYMSWLADDNAIFVIAIPATPSKWAYLAAGTLGLYLYISDPGSQ